MGGAEGVERRLGRRKQVLLGELDAASCLDQYKVNYLSVVYHTSFLQRRLPEEQHQIERKDH